MQNRVRTAHPGGGPTLNPYKIGAVLAQLGSFLTTYAFFAAVLIGAPPLLTFGIAVGVEFLLTLGKGLLFNTARHDDAVGWAAILFDTLLNGGGLWPYAARLAATPTAIMFTEALHLDGQMGSVPALVLALVFGFWLAVSPHRLWRAGSKRTEAD
jgi:hypothetical protein